MTEQLPYLYAVLYDFMENMQIENEPSIVIGSFSRGQEQEKSIYEPDKNILFLNLAYFKTLASYNVPSAMLAEVFKAIKFNQETN